MAADPVAAHAKSVHRRMGRLSAQNMCDELNNSLCDYVDTISDYADDPDDDPVYCPSDYPDDVCDFLSTIDQSWNHYLNTQHSTGEKGNADQNAADEADAAKSRVDGNDYVEGAIKTGRALHYIQDAGTLVHTGREGEQAADYSIHYDFESWVRDNWGSYFKDDADTGSIMHMDGTGDIQSWTWNLADWAHDDLQDQWWDIDDGGSYYYSSTQDAQAARIADAAVFSNGTVHWIWENA
jgi:hypothetical protein